MALLPNPLRSREQRLPVYEKIDPTSKERYSNDQYYYSSSADDELEPFSPGPSSSNNSSRKTSGSISSKRQMLAKKKKVGSLLRRPASVYPYRLPPKITRYIVCTVIGLIVLMILSLVRASQVENWKVENGKLEKKPPPPAVWEKFPFLERYYGGIRTLVPLKENMPEYPRDKNEPDLLKDIKEAAKKAKAEQEEQQQEQKQEQGQDEDEQKPKSESKRRAPKSKSQAWNKYSDRSEEKDIQECFVDAAGKIRIPQLRYYEGRPMGFPDHVAGSYEALKLPEDICFERFGRYGPYGFGYSQRAGGLGTGENGEKDGSPTIWETTPRVDYRGVNWADAQRRCYQKNADRYLDAPSKTNKPHGFFIHEAPAPPATSTSAMTLKDRAVDEEESVLTPTPGAKSGKESVKSDMDDKKDTKKNGEKDNKKEMVKNKKPVPAKDKKPRTAVVIRCWDEYFFREDDIANIRSMVSELSLASGGRYDVHLLVQVKNEAAHPIWADEEIYERRIRDVIPEEFRGMATLWTETQMLALYQGVYDLFSRGPELPVHGVYRGLSMAMQHFASMHPEYEYFWQWEMDVRYTGHYFDFVSKIENWAKVQPRKGLWERNARFYFPKVHGSWDDFSQMARVQSEMGTLGADNVWRGMPGARGKRPEEMTKNDKTVWGPQRPREDNDWFEPGNDPIAPSSYEQDRYNWGVGEEADYISFNPMFDPDGTTWGLKDDITGYNRSAGMPPRRAHIITTARLSRRLLMSMHKMTALKKQFAFPEMWPATVAIQHGFKAVFAPHPMFVDRKWPVDYMASMFNGGRDGASGGSRTSIFGEREHNLHGLSWFYNSGFAPNLYRRWLGLKVNNDGGEEFELTEDKSKTTGDGVGNMPGGEGRMCLPPMLLHPIKDVELPVEAPPEEGSEAPESDPSA